MYDVAIIGGGPAGASAGLFTAKAGKKTVVFDHGKSITKMAWVENHYGVDGIKGPDLLKQGQAQAAKFGAEIVSETVNGIVTKGEAHEIQTETRSYEVEHIIFATGMSVKAAENLGVDIIKGTEPRVAKIIQTDENGHTSMPKVWAAGTAAGASVHTIITAGDGAKVAVNVISALNGKRYVDHDVLE
ncbi:FAD-dependent oxidoreductase [Halobacillus sp. ACCC02827]|uniref:FAD-dependent oxidoreductase n=1 Tax=Bacillaceae TaxID=186817 RepID=UPI0002A5176F|nr:MULTISPECIES: FAD-dependent oxidoreductase [Bacillaceae]ELK45411.1 thioredoxin reductase-like protein [Halobacillus sp. BAB-2008]QHT46441.1 FAD-dependent oxidoreductase [Bacillus sp. SB49]WJE17249.1 FAD-dependent oxidoreductase [Halobacillus sp. ACCC02827]